MRAFLLPCSSVGRAHHAERLIRVRNGEVGGSNPPTAAIIGGCDSGATYNGNKKIVKKMEEKKNVKAGKDGMVRKGKRICKTCGSVSKSKEFCTECGEIFNDIHY